MKGTIILFKLKKNKVQILHAMVTEITLNFLAKHKYRQFS